MTRGTTQTPTLLRSLNPAEPDDVVITLPVMGASDVARLAAQLRANRSREDREERAARLDDLAEGLRAASSELTPLLVREIAKLPVEAQAEVEFAASIAAHYAQLLRVENESSTGRELPVDLAGVITPFNFPCSIAVMKVAAAYGAGASVLWKPSPHALAIAARLDELFKSTLGEGSAMVIAAAEEPFLEIVHHVDALSFTGGAAGATLLWRAASARPIPMQLELGSCNPTLVGRDFPADEAAEVLRVSCLSYAGQKCSSTRRVIAPAARITEVFDALTELFEGERVGNPADVSTTIPPLISRDSAERFYEHLEGWEAAAATIVQLPAPREQSDCYVAPTIALANGDSEAFQRDVFGPAVVLLPYDAFNEAVALANATPYGLFAGLLSHDQVEQEAFCDGVAAGILKINQPTPGLSPLLPSQGWRASGLGPGELGDVPFRPFLRVQTVYPH